MKLYIADIKSIILLTFFLSLPASGDLIKINWTAVFTRPQLTQQRLNLFNATVFRQQNGNSDFYYTLNDQSDYIGVTNTYGIHADGIPLQSTGQSLLIIMAEAMIQSRRSSSELHAGFARMNHQIISFDIFPLHWIAWLHNVQNNPFFDRLHYLNPDTVYVNLTFLENDPGTSQRDVTQNEPNTPGNPIPENAPDSHHNPAFENNGDEPENNQAVQENTTTGPSYSLGVILHQVQTGDFRLLVTNYPLSDAVVNATLNQTETNLPDNLRRLHYETTFSTSQLFELASLLSAPQRSDQQTQTEPQNTLQETVSPLRAFLTYVLTYCCCARLGHTDS